MGFRPRQPLPDTSLYERFSDEYHWTPIELNDLPTLCGLCREKEFHILFEKWSCKGRCIHCGYTAEVYSG